METDDYVIEVNEIKLENDDAFKRETQTPGPEPYNHSEGSDTEHYHIDEEGELVSQNPVRVVSENTDGDIRAPATAIIQTFIIENGELTTNNETPEDVVYSEDEGDSVVLMVNDEGVITTPNEIEYVMEEDEIEGEVEESITGDKTEEYEEETIDDPSGDPNNAEIIEKFNCEECPRVFKTSVGLNRHIKLSHHEAKDIKPKMEDDPLDFEVCACCGEPSDSAHTLGDIQCPKCSAMFHNNVFLTRHNSLEHPENPNLYKCIVCKKTFDHKADYSTHLVTHPLYTVWCPTCDRAFSRKYHLDRHYAHSSCCPPDNPNMEKQKFTCKDCGKSFIRKDNLKEHRKIHEGSVKRRTKDYPCSHCGKNFQSQTLLSVHERTHTGEKPYQCDLCPKAFPSSGAMKKHRRMHTGERPYSCNACDAKFAAKETLNRHFRTHTGDKPHQCKFCGKAFIQAAQLRAHIFHHTGENAYTCQYCNRAFNRRLRLTNHIKFMHEGAEPINCPNCPKTFFRKEDLNRHQLSHSGEKPCKCEICNKAFAVKSSLKIHMLTHKKEPPCSCEYCGRAFIRQDCLMRHMRARHRDALENVLLNAEKRRLQQQLLSAATSAAADASDLSLATSSVWNELTITESIKELLTLLVDEQSLEEFGYPVTPVDKVLDSVIKRCGHTPASEDDFDYLGRMRENAKLLFTAVIDDDAVKSLLNNQTIDEVIVHVLRLAKSQQEDTEEAAE